MSLMTVEKPSTASATFLIACDRARSVMTHKSQESSGQVSYTAYGNRGNLSGATTGFNGSLAESITGHYLLGNGYRAYNPTLMRFNSPDGWSPFGRGGLNMYAYCSGDPVNYIDPSGHSQFSPTIMAGIANWRTNAQMSTVYRGAPSAKQYIDNLASGLAGQHGGTVLAAPLKRRDRAMEKARNLFGGDARKSNDIARNTLIVDPSQIPGVINNLESHDNITLNVITANQTPVGYSGVHAKINTPSGVLAEMQIHTPQMIYANLPTDLARNALGDTAYNSLDDFARRNGYEGGQGHKYYEIFRNLNLSVRQREEARQAGRDYYSFMTTGAIRL
ncbi:hypothetical protein MXL15_06815 [Pseudomonas mosselii]|uniref:RHS repeat-associated core domain-containing protein n=1 Tax=Pseudomonas mosselii TaxID=78327 RepID=UPI002DB72B05|nr:RHS repeat-associated core domain-containing protein [Pseudomonas mosselii]MEB5931909.1 hypothetical protein [Pseudomonas mosselii]